MEPYKSAPTGGGSDQPDQTDEDFDLALGELVRDIRDEEEAREKRRLEKSSTGVVAGSSVSLAFNSGYGVAGSSVAASSSGYGVAGYSVPSSSGGGYGVAGYSVPFSSGGYGVAGSSVPFSSGGYGVAGYSVPFSSGYGVASSSVASSSGTYGVGGYSVPFSSGYGVAGSSVPSSGGGYGVAGSSVPSSGGGYGVAGSSVPSSSSGGYGVAGYSVPFSSGYSVPSSSGTTRTTSTSLAPVPQEQAMEVVPRYSDQLIRLAEQPFPIVKVGSMLTQYVCKVCRTFLAFPKFFQSVYPPMGFPRELTFSHMENLDNHQLFPINNRTAAHVCCRGCQLHLGYRILPIDTFPVPFDKGEVTVDAKFVLYRENGWHYFAEDTSQLCELKPVVSFDLGRIFYICVCGVQFAGRHYFLNLKPSDSYGYSREQPLNIYYGTPFCMLMGVAPVTTTQIYCTGCHRHRGSASVDSREPNIVRFGFALELVRLWDANQNTTVPFH